MEPELETPDRFYPILPRVGRRCQTESAGCIKPGSIGIDPDLEEKQEARETLFPRCHTLKFYSIYSE